MPICPKCGKSRRVQCSEQALSYHLNKKFKCGTWKCMICSKSFDTKLNLQLHELKCGVPERTYPDYSILRMFYDKSTNVCCENLRPRRYRRKPRGSAQGMVVNCNDDTYIGVRSNQIENCVFKSDNVIII